MKLRIGSRDSKLAVKQSNMVIDQILKNHKDIDIELITMKTTGDIILDKTLDKIGGKGLFLKELDKALIDNKTDISVHSLKDMPMDIDEDMPILAYLERENPLDVLILPKGKTEIDKTKPIGSSSKRRVLQLEKLYPECYFKPVRGNLQTRLQKLDNGEYSALVLAYAGIKRLGLEDRIFKIFSSEEIIPACGQGIIAVQGKKGQEYPFIKELNNKKAEYEARCERAFVRELDGGCSLPICAYAILEGDEINLTGFYADDNNYIIEKMTSKKEDFEKIGIELAKKVKELIK